MSNGNRGCSEIYTADWLDGPYIEWDNQEQQLFRNGTTNVILKKLENIEKANRSWLDECKSHFTIEEQQAYHSLQLSLSIPDKIGDIISEQSECQAKQNNFTIIDNKNETKGKSKRIYSEDEKEDLTDNNKSKKIKLNSNKVEFQYMQRNYFVNDDVEDDETFNNPNFHSEDQDELEIPEDGF
ncbi:unnamed protein product [Rhizophagus irregularis]|nr:unnamed protein product [Rhizophagus irregularis]